MPDLTPEDQLEIESDRRRMVTAAFRLGTEAKIWAILISQMFARALPER